MNDAVSRCAALALVLLLGACAGAAASGNGGAGAAPRTPSSPGVSAPGPLPAGADTANLSSDGGLLPSPLAPVLTPSAPPLEMKAPEPSEFAEALQGLGLDARDLPPIEKLDPRALRGVMKFMAKALGARCRDCHEEDFAAPTPRKRVAARMWNEFVGKLAFADGSALFCDSCHKGRLAVLDRRDSQALSAWMAANFVDKLKRKDGQEHGCESCHVNQKMRFLADWAAP